jgi:tetratricopeptide (TPR) repeat protein
MAPQELRRTMAGRSHLAIAALALALGSFLSTSRADDPKPDPARKPADYALPGEDPPAAFVPKTPRTVAEQKKLEATRLYVEARALEDQRQFTRAVLTLEKALEEDPESVSVLRRLSLLCGATGKIERSIEYGRRAVAADPGDAATIARIVEHYRRREPAKAEPFLKEVLANPKLNKGSSEALVLEFELAQLYEGTGQFDKAADALAKVVEAIDTKAGNRLSPADQRRILGDEEAAAYVKFGGLFLKANRRDLALRCFRRAEVYDDTSPQIPLMISVVLLEGDKPAEALEQVERAIKRQHQGREAFDVLAQILKKLGRQAEVVPRTEAAAKAEPKNIPLQYALADRYREAGQVDKADDLIKTLIEVQPDLKGFGALYASLLKDKKTEELLRLLTKVAERLRRDDAVDPQIAALVADPAYADKVIDAGLAMLTSDPPRLDRPGWVVLVKIATRAKKTDKLVNLYRWAVKEFPSPQASRELIDALTKQKQYDAAEAEFEAMMARFPEERNPLTMLFLAQVRINAHREDAAIATLRDILKQIPNDPDATRLLAFALGQKGKIDEAVALLRDALKNDPTNVDLMRMVAGVYQQAGKNDEQIAYLKSVVEKYPNNDEVVKFARSFLSIAYTNAGDYAKGEAELEVLFAKTPDDPGVNNDLGYLYAEQGKKLEQAESMIRKAVADEPENAAYLDSLGWVLFKRGKAKEAVEPLQKAIEHLEGREDATIPEHLGDVYFEIKDRAKAKESWEKAEKVAAGMTPPDKRLPEIRKKLESLKKLETGPQPASGANP